MAEELSASSKESLSTVFEDCLTYYRKLLLALNAENCRVVRLEQVDVTHIQDEFGRVKIWGDQSKAILPPRARGSLDDTLRNKSDLQGTIRGILKRLRWCLDQAIPIVEIKYDDLKGSDQDSITSMSADSDSDVEDNADHERPKVSKISWLMQQAFEQIQSLFHLSSLLRRPSFTGKYIRSVNRNARVDLEKQESSLAFCLSRFDCEHVFEKVRQWNGLSKSTKDISYKGEEPVSSDQIQGRTDLDIDCCEDVTALCQRLANANTRRREQLQYWTDYPDNPIARETISAPLTLGVPMKETPAPEAKRAGESQSQVSTIKPSDQNHLRQNDETRSSLSKQSFSTVAKSAIFETKTQSGRLRTVYAQTIVVKGRQSRVPNAPTPPKGSSSSLCPYCGMELIGREIEDRQTWKRHVFRDLRPYICTYLECQTPEKLYLTRHDWIYHEMQMHRRQFVCGECNEKHLTRDSMETHLKAHHHGLFSESQLPIVLDMCDRPVDDSEQSLCILCGEDMSLLELQNHLAMHLEDIALFVLPSSVEDGEAEGGSKMTNRAAKLKSEAETNGDELSSVSSVHFSDPGGEPGYKQTSMDFQKLLTMKQPEYNSKVTFWKEQDLSGEDNPITVMYHILKVLQGHSREVYAVAFSPDGKLVASASCDRTVRLWDAATGATLQTLHGHSDLVRAVAFSPDGKLIASASSDCTVRLWHAATGATLQTLHSHSDYVRAVAFSPDGKLVASASYDRTVRLWHAATGAALQTLKGHSGYVYTVAFSPDSKLVASASYDRTVRLWDAATGAALQTLEGHSNLVFAVAFSPDGKLVASASEDRTVRLWHAATGAALQTLEGHSGYVYAVAFSPDSKLVASASYDRTVRLWETATGAALQTLEGHSNLVFAVAFSPDGKLVASASEDRTVRLWEATE